MSNLSLPARRRRHPAPGVPQRRGVPFGNILLLWTVLAAHVGLTYAGHPWYESSGIIAASLTTVTVASTIWSGRWPLKISVK